MGIVRKLLIKFAKERKSFSGCGNVKQVLTKYTDELKEKILLICLFLCCFISFIY